MMILRALALGLLLRPQVAIAECTPSKVVLAARYEAWVEYQDPTGAVRLADVMHILPGALSAIFSFEPAGGPEIAVAMKGPPTDEASGPAWVFATGLTGRAVALHVVNLKTGEERIYAPCERGGTFPTVFDTSPW